MTHIERKGAMASRHCITVLVCPKFESAVPGLNEIEYCCSTARLTVQGDQTMVKLTIMCGDIAVSAVRKHTKNNVPQTASSWCISRSGIVFSRLHVVGAFASDWFKLTFSIEKSIWIVTHSGWPQKSLNYFARSLRQFWSTIINFVKWCFEFLLNRKLETLLLWCWISCENTNTLSMSPLQLRSRTFAFVGSSGQATCKTVQMSTL